MSQARRQPTRAEEPLKGTLFHGDDHLLPQELGCTGITRKHFVSPNSPAPAGLLGKGLEDGQGWAEALQPASSSERGPGREGQCEHPAERPAERPAVSYPWWRRQGKEAVSAVLYQQLAASN